MTKAAVIGLDGAAMHLLDPLFKAGVMPRLAQLRDRGASGILRSTLPAFTPSAWTSAMTGVNPGRHGVYGFYDRHIQFDSHQLVHPGRFRAPTIWEMANSQGASVGMYNVPLTYPPQPLDGWMVSGMMTPTVRGGPSGFAYPANVERDLLDRIPGYMPDLESSFEEDWRDRSLCDRAIVSLEHRRRALEYLVSTHPVDLLFAVIETPDRLQHVYYAYLDPSDDLYRSSEAKKLRPLLHEAFRAIDDVVGIIAESVDDGSVLVCSDHGFTRWELTLRVNALLSEWGYLHLRASARALSSAKLKRVVRLGARVVPWRLVRGAKERSQQVAVDWARTRVFASPKTLEILYVNLAGREPYGIVPVSELAGLKSEVIDRFESLRDPSGRDLRAKVWRSEEVFRGDASDTAPDLVPVLLDNRVYLETGLFFGEPFSDTRRLPRGLHHPHGVIIVAGPGIRTSSDINASLVDVAPTALYMAGLLVPAELDGAVVTRAYREAALGQRPIGATAAATARPRETASPYSEEEEAKIEDSLRGLGYL